MIKRTPRYIARHRACRGTIVTIKPIRPIFSVLVPKLPPAGGVFTYTRERRES